VHARVHVLLGERFVARAARVLRKNEFEVLGELRFRSPRDGKLRVIRDFRRRSRLAGLHVGELERIESSDGALSIQLTNRIKQLVLNRALGVPNVVAFERAVELEVEERRFGARIGVEQIVFLRGLVASTSDGSESEKGERGGGKSTGSHLC